MIERNIVFIYPLSSTLQELKQALEEDSNFMVYELDAVGEYSQLIGVLEHSMTFSSDLKKTEQYLEMSKSFVKTKESRNILTQDKSMMHHVFSKYQKLGLNEILMEGTPLKNVLHKIDMFFSVFEQMERRKEEAKQKELAEKMMAQASFPSAKKEKEVYNKNEKLRIEKMASLSDGEIGHANNKKGVQFEDNTGNFGQGKAGFQFGSPFDQLQRKNLKTFDPVDAIPKLKKSNFNLPENEDLNQSKRSKFEEVEKENKKRKTLNLNPAEINQKKGKFEEVEREHNNKRAKFEEAHRDLSRRRAIFEEQEKDLSKRKGLDLNAQNEAGKEGRKFEEAQRDLSNKRAKFEEQQKDLNRKKLELDQVEAEYKKKKKFLEEELNLEKQNHLIDELEDLNKKKNKLIEEMDGDLQKQRGLFEEEIIENKKKGHFEEVNSDKKAKKYEENELDLDQAKKNLETEEAKGQKKHSQFDEIQLDQRNQKTSMIDETVDPKKKTTFEEGHLTKKKKSSFEELKNEKEIKQNQNNTVELKRKNKEFDELLIDNLLNEEDVLSLENAGVYKEQVLDYAKFREEKRRGSLSLTEDKLQELEKKAVESLLEIPEPHFYENKSFGLEYLVLLNDFLMREKVEPAHLMKFIHFALVKEYQADFSIYMKRKSTGEEYFLQDFRCFYHGHETSKKIYAVEEWEALEESEGDEWGKVHLPTWRDETYQLEINTFIYPYFEDDELLGFSIAHFKKGSINNHGQAKEVEALLMSLKGVILEEHFFIMEGG